MKKKDLKRLAFLGIASGVLVTQPTGMEAIESHIRSINLDYVLAKPSCKAHGGCAGLTAERNRTNSTIYQDEESEENTSDDNEEEKKYKYT